jgi:transketolase
VRELHAAAPINQCPIWRSGSRKEKLVKLKKNRIELHRETLLTLDRQQLDAVAGATKADTNCGTYCLSHLPGSRCSCQNSC